MKKESWSINDLIDLEYFLERDELLQEEPGVSSVAKRDRGIYLNTIGPEDPGTDLTLKPLIRSWLDQRRTLEKSESGSHRPLPGEAFGDVYRLTAYGLLIAGILSGSGLAFSFLTYRGIEPLNVSVYIAVFVLLQCASLVVLMGFRLIRSVKRSPFGTSVVFSLISGLITTLLQRIRQGARRSMSGSTRGGLAAVAGLIRGKRQIYGSLFYWPIFILGQIFGVGFNVGVLSATLLSVLGSDVAFGWQSTIQFSAQAVYKIVQGLAIPWSWLVPAHVAHPTLSEIQGSHMVLKDGIYHLATQDLVSWWPFLCLAVLAYGLVPRVVLLMLGLIFKKRALSQVALNHAACVRLHHRMVTPSVRTEGHVVGTGEAIHHAEQVPSPSVSHRKDSPLPASMVALIPGDIFEDCRDEDLTRVVQKIWGGSVETTYRFGDDAGEDENLLHELSQRTKTEKASPVLILQESWQPPIRENLRFIQDLRRAVGETMMIWIGLIGRPRQDTIFTPVKGEDWKTWHQRLSSLGDPYLGLERLTIDEG